MGLPARSVYFFGNGAERGLDLAFEHIQRNKITGTVYLASADDAHDPRLWGVLRQRPRKEVALLSLALSDWAGSVLSPWNSTHVASLAFDAEHLHRGKPWD